jgi:ATP-binding cassette subfamily G (WHITE) protein 2 (SNQ2)
MSLCFLSFFRMVGAWCRHFGIAAQISGVCIMGMMVYAGYLIPVPEMHDWFRWIAYLNPASYCLQALIASEMGNRELACITPQFVPFGPSYMDDSFRSCTSPGSAPGADTIDGETYIESQYDASVHTVWRNFGIIVAFWIFWAFLAAVGFEVNLASGTGAKVLFDRSSRREELAMRCDPEKTAGSSSSSNYDPKGDVSVGETTFTFENIDYFVHHEGKEKQLLQSVSGYVKPGQLVALMGSSGAGKTTLMDVLAQRKDSGRIEGSIMVSASNNCSGLFMTAANSYHRSMDILKASPSSGPLATANRMMFMSLHRRFWNLSYSLLGYAKATTLPTRKKFATCTASWIFWSCPRYSMR